MCELTVTGKAFLWHQIRCIVSVLLFVGHGREHPEVRYRQRTVISFVTIFSYRQPAIIMGIARHPVKQLYSEPGMCAPDNFKGIF